MARNTRKILQKRDPWFRSESSGTIDVKEGGMDLGPLEGWDKERLLEYVRSLLWQYRLVDAFWFINLERRFDLPTAEAVNADVWGKVAGLSARDIKKRFSITERGLSGLKQTLEIFPWALLVGYQVREEKGELIIEVPHCPAQEGRLKHGLGEYVCKEMHRREFEGFAAEIDPAIRVACDFAPPDPHPQELFCRWRFYEER
jgi:hypothetical protein